MTTLGYEDVRRLDVAVDDAFGVRRLQPISDLSGDLQHFIDGRTTCPLRRRGDPPSPLGRVAGGEGFCHSFPQRLPVQVLHHDEGTAFVLTDVVDRADVGVVQSRCSPRLALEAAESYGIASDSLRKKFESNETVKSGVLSLVHQAHSAATKLLENPVVRNGLVQHRRQLAYLHS